MYKPHTRPPHVPISCKFKLKMGGSSAAVIQQMTFFRLRDALKAFARERQPRRRISRHSAPACLEAQVRGLTPGNRKTAHIVCDLLAFRCATSFISSAFCTMDTQSTSMTQPLLRLEKRGQVQVIPPQGRRGSRGIILATFVLVLLAISQIPAGTGSGSPITAQASCTTLRALGKQAR
jgi:hypothetical protein